MALAASAPVGQILAVTSRILLSFQISGWWWFALKLWFSDGYKKSYWFSSCSTFSWCDGSSADFQALYMLVLILYGEGNGTPLQYSCLENPMDGGAWWAAVHGVAESWTRLSGFTFTFHFHALEKEMATHSSVLAWRIQGRQSLVGCCLWGRTESDTTEAT